MREFDRAKTEPRARPTVWLTRDSDASGLWDMVDVWTAPPQRHVDTQNGGAFWYRDDEGTTKIARHHVNVAWLLFRTTPDTDRECVRIG